MDAGVAWYGRLVASPNHADYRPSYNKEAATDGWQRLQTWFKKYGAK